MRKKKPIYHLSRFPKQVKRMTKKIFDEDVMLRKCEAQVTDCIELKDGFGIELDQTVFYPEGGGQLSDTGELLIGEKTVAVIHVREKDGHIFHETKKVNLYLLIHSLSPQLSQQLVLKHVRLPYNLYLLKIVPLRFYIFHNQSF